MEPATNSQTSEQPQASSRFNRSLAVIGELVKIAFILAFVCYAVGYIIWNSYLGQYGVSPSLGLLQVEFVSAAICYFVLLISFVLPSAFIWHALVYRRHAAGKVVWPIVALWTYLLWRIQFLFFPDRIQFKNGMILLSIFSMIGLLHFAAVMCLRRKFGASRVFQLVAQREWAIAYPFALYFIGFFNSVPNPMFFVSLMMLYLTAIAGIGINILDHWTTESTPVKVLYGLAVVLLLVANIRDFGTEIFKFVPRAVGGGKPQLALLELSSGRDNVGKWIAEFATNELVLVTNAVVMTNNVALVNTNSIVSVNRYMAAKHGFIGPVSILFRSEKEILFVDTLQPNSKERTRARQIRADVIEAIEFLP